MSYHSKRVLTSIFFSCCLVLGYAFYVFRLNPEISHDLIAWSRIVLVFIGIGIIGSIILHILTVISYTIKISVKDSELSETDVDRVVNSTLVEDEMDKMISLRASRIGYFVSGFSGILAIAALASGVAPFVAFHIILAGFMIGNLVEGAISIYLYEKGVQYG
ncbi:hypothetical protein [Candidatus Enterococcus murrayae]|uniref:DUF3169 family protein n=1 Tax=Candidatus Enterococcus murrayae TaxID=2815321 RepID=A0ABS3HM53_9ENTE|nr:hypothetical protein [Enterococcus sp. MJM16]MBO0454527.1 hypothetical protein [Enterococcus sp. MJM16]